MAKPHTHSAKTSNPPRGAAVTGRMMLIWLALAVYLVLFYLCPLEGGTAVANGTLRRGHVLMSIFLGDELLQNWTEGATWNALVQRARILVVAGAIFGTAAAAGWVALEALGVRRLFSRLEYFVLSAGVGLNLASLFTLTLGLAGLARREVVAAAGLIVLAAAGVRVWRKLAARSSPAERAESGGGASGVSDVPLYAFDDVGLGSAWLWLAVPFAIALALGAMLPPVEFDVREYHLQAPKEFYQAGRITFLEHNVYANMPLGAEMLTLLGMIVGGDWWLGALAGKLLTCCFAPLAALLLFAAGRRLAGATAGIVAALVYISIPWIALVSMQGLVDGVVAFYLMAAVYLAIVWRQFLRAGATPEAQRLLAPAGFMAGGAVSCKYPAVLFCVVPLAAWICWQLLANARCRQSSAAAWSASLGRSLGVFLLALTLGCGLWFAKNAVLTGNPVYPLLYDWFDGRSRTPEKNDQWLRGHDAPNFDVTDLGRRAVGFTLTSTWLSPLLAPLAALAWLSCRRPLVRGLMIYLCYVLAAWWLLTHRIDRFWVPILPVVSLLGGIGATWTNTRAWRVTLVGLLGFGLAANFLVVTSGVLGDNRFLADQETLRHDPRHISAWHAYLNEHAAEVSRVLLVGDAQPFDLDVPVAYNTVFDDCIFEQLAKGRGSRQIHEALAEGGISHVLVAWSEVRRYRSPGNYGFTKFIEPRVFEGLVRDGVLAELPAIDEEPGQLFRVTPLR